MSDLKNNITLRPVCQEDCELIFDWRNSDFIVKHGSLQRLVTKAEHEKWFARILVDPDYAVFIISVGSTPVGQIRFQRRATEQCVVSVYLVEEWTQKGVGIIAIKQGCKQIFSSWPVETVVAEVRQNNPIGQKVFSKIGFEKSSSGDEVDEHYTYLLTRDGVL